MDQKICILIHTYGNAYPWICQAQIFPTDQSPTDTGTSMDWSMDVYWDLCVQYCVGLTAVNLWYFIWLYSVYIWTGIDLHTHVNSRVLKNGWEMSEIQLTYHFDCILLISQWLFMILESISVQGWIAIDLRINNDSRITRKGWEMSNVQVKYCFDCISLISQLFWEISGSVSVDQIPVDLWITRSAICTCICMGTDHHRYGFIVLASPVVTSSSIYWRIVLMKPWQGTLCN